MTTNETILWQRFMQGKGVMNNFEYLYRQNRFDNRDLDQYLEEVEAEDVIMSAFGFKGTDNSILGYRYWKDMDDKWQVKLREYRETGDIAITEPKVFCPHCGRLLPKDAFSYNSKGQLHKHCKECEGGYWDKQKKEREKQVKEQEKLEKEARQLEKEIIEKQAKLERLAGESEKTTKVCAHCGKRKPKMDFAPSDTSEDGLQSWCNACQSGLESESNHIDNMERQNNENQASTLDKLTAPKLGEYDATLHYKSTQKSITFNAILSEVLQKGQFTKCYLNTDRQRRQFLIFNRVEGANVVGVSSRSSMLLGINSAEICRALSARFNLQMGDNYYLHITRNMSRVKDVATIEILAVRSREEYVAIAQRREGIAPSEEETVPEKKVAPVQEKPAQKKVVVKTEEMPSVEPPLLDFGDVATPPTAEDILQQLIDRHLASERDLAVFLHKRGWKLQEPVRSYKKFTL